LSIFYPGAIQVKEKKTTIVEPGRINSWSMCQDATIMWLNATLLPHCSILRRVAVDSIMLICRTLLRIEILVLHTVSPQIFRYLVLSMPPLFSLPCLLVSRSCFSFFLDIIVQQDLCSSTVLHQTFCHTTSDENEMLLVVVFSFLSVSFHQISPIPWEH
jgi:hypothetical protein